MLSRAVNRPTRARNPPVVYTPSIPRSSTSRQMNYKLNFKKTLDKKIDAADREATCHIEYKAGTLVITYNAGTYEVLKSSIYNYYDQSEEKTYRLHTKTSESSMQSAHQQPMIVEESLSIKSSNNDTSCRQLFRIYMFNITSRIDVNGYKVQSFILEDLDKICKMLYQDKTCSQLNNRIKNICELAKDQIDKDNEVATNTINTRQRKTRSYDKSREASYSNNGQIDIRYTQNKNLNDKQLAISNDAYNDEERKNDQHICINQTTNMPDDMHFVTTIDKRFNAHYDTQMDSCNTTVANMQVDFLEAESETHSRDGDSISNPICMSCKTPVIDDKSVDFSVCGQYLHAACKGINKSRIILIWHIFVHLVEY